MLKKLSFSFCLFFIVFISVAQNGSVGNGQNDYRLVNSGNCLEIYFSDTSSYSKMGLVDKKNMVEAIAKDSKKQRIVVRYGYYRDVWIYDGKSEYKFVTKKNVNESQPVAFQKYSDKEYSQCDFFTYTGGAMDFSSSRFSFSVSTRIGCYFFKRLLDCSLTYTYSVSTMSTTSLSSMNLGLMARVYPFFKMESMQRIHLSPYIGFEGAYYATFVSGNRSDDGNFIGHLGLSWLIGPGSLDIGVQSGLKEYFAATIGYSFCPSLLSNRRKSAKR